MDTMYERIPTAMKKKNYLLWSITMYASSRETINA
jgi:hypothetical protein